VILRSRDGLALTRVSAWNASRVYIVLESIRSPCTQIRNLTFMDRIVSYY